VGAIADAANSLKAALDEVAGLRVTTDPGEQVAPPYAIVGPPALTWEAGCAGPTSARFLVYVVVDADDRALERLWDLVPAVSDAIDATTDAVVVRADPGSWNSGGSDLPAYTVEVDVAL